MRVEELIQSMEAGTVLTGAQLTAVRRGDLDAEPGQERPSALSRLARCAAEHGYENVFIEMLASQNQAVLASVAAGDGYDTTPAHRVASKGWEKIVAVLDASRHKTVWASLFARNKALMTPADMAAKEGQAAVLEVLGASRHAAVRDSLFAKDNLGTTSAHYAAREGRVAVLAVLGASRHAAVRDSLFAKDTFGRTPAHFAALAGHTAVLNALLASDNPDVRDSLFAKDTFGRTPAHNAALDGRVDFINALLAIDDVDVRASLTATDKFGMKPEQFALRGGYGKVMEALHPTAPALARAVIDLETDGSVQARNLLTELQRPVLGDFYKTVEYRRPPLLRPSEVADAEARWQLFRRVAEAYTRQPENLPNSRAEALTAYAAFAQGAGRVHFQAVIERHRQAAGSGDAVRNDAVGKGVEGGVQP